MKNLQNKIILITGASSGIGKACAEQFAAAGAHVILTARRLERVEKLAQQLQQHYSIKALPLALDVQDKIAVNKMVESLASDWQKIDVLVNNAGLALTTDSMQDANSDNWDIMIDTNIKGLLYVTRAVISGMVKRQSGHVINISSIAGFQTYPGGNIYSATKHAVRALSQSMHLDLLGENIRISDIAPGLVETEFSEVRWSDKQRADDFYQDIDALQADDIADAVVYCASRPKHVDVSQMVIMPTIQASANHVYRPSKI